MNDPDDSHVSRHSPNVKHLISIKKQTLFESAYYKNHLTSRVLSFSVSLGEYVNKIAITKIQHKYRDHVAEVSV